MRRFMVLLTVVGLVGAAAALAIPGAGAQQTDPGGQAVVDPGGVAPVTINKVALNAPAGTKFTIQLKCDNTAIIPPGGTSKDDVDTLDFTYTVDAAGVAVADGTNTVRFDNKADCKVTETVSGGAETTSYQCADNFDLIDLAAPGSLGSQDPDGDPEAQVPAPITSFCTTFGPQAEPISFVVESEGQEVTVTVTNTFPAPAAVAVEVPVITFTG